MKFDDFYLIVSGSEYWKNKTMSKIKIGIIGCLGRMGKALTAETLDHPDTVLIGGTEMADSPHIDELIQHPNTGVKTDICISKDAEGLIKNADVILDFTCPTATIMHCALAEKFDTAMVIGTTGLSNDDEKSITESSNKAPIVYASNYSLGVNLLFYLTRKAAGILGDDFDIEICETHHRDKIDAPSGTALSLGHEAAKGRNAILENITAPIRDGIGEKRVKGEIGFAALRGGNVAGDHTVHFFANDEQIELTHKASDRSIFARGALKAAIWVHSKKRGLFDMSDVLELDKTD